MNESACRLRAQGARSARLATSRSDGMVDLVPIVFSFFEGGVVFAVDHKPKSTTRLQRLVNIEANPNVTLLFDHYDDDWEQLWWVRMRGIASNVEHGARREAALDVLAQKYAQYCERRPDSAVIEIEPRSWLGWSGGS